METGDWKTDFEKRTIYGIIANNASLCPNSGMRSRQELSMISEERVKELYHLAAFDEYENKKYYQAGEYTMWDYVGKEIVKSFFSGTIAFILLIVFWWAATARARPRWRGCSWGS